MGPRKCWFAAEGDARHIIGVVPGADGSPCSSQCHAAPVAACMLNRQLQSETKFPSCYAVFGPKMHGVNFFGSAYVEATLDGAFGQRFAHTACAKNRQRPGRGQQYAGATYMKTPKNDITSLEISGTQHLPKPWASDNVRANSQLRRVSFMNFVSPEKILAGPRPAFRK